MDGAAVQKRTAAAPGGKHFLRERIIHYAVRHAALMHQRHGDVAVVHTADKIGGAVNGVHHKHPRLVRGFVFPLLTEKTGLRHQRQQLPLQKRLHRHIVFRHQVGGAVLFTGVFFNIMGIPDHVSCPAHNGDQSV